MKIAYVFLLNLLIFVVALPANGAVLASQVVALRVATEKTTYRLGEVVKVTSYYLNKSNKALYVTFAPTKQIMTFKRKGDKPKVDTADFDKSAIESAGYLALMPKKEIAGGKSEFNRSYIDKPGVWEIQLTEYRDGGRNKKGEILWQGTIDSNAIIITVK